jgi:hypothetical protein
MAPLPTRKVAASAALRTSLKLIFVSFWVHSNHAGHPAGMGRTI